MNKRPVKLLIASGLIIVILLAIVYRQNFDARTLESWIQDAGAAAPVVFIIIYAIATVFFLPGSVMTLAGGALFGPVWGTLYNLVGATLGATLAFLIARYLAADWVEKRASGRLERMKKGVEQEGWRFVALVRLVPLFPFNLLNYGLGLTRIRLLEYASASFLFMLPGALAYTYLGYVGREAVGGGEGLIQKSLLALALLAAVTLLPGMIGRMRQRPKMRIDDLKRRMQPGNKPLLVLDVRSAEDHSGEQGHIPDSINIPLEELKNRMAELKPQADTTIAIVCRTDIRSAKAARILDKEGFSDVNVVEQGMTAWNAAGEPVIRGETNA